MYTHLLIFTLDGSYHWADFSQVQYQNWAPGEPNGFSDQHCGRMFKATFKGQWDDFDCSQLHYYICKMPKRKWPYAFIVDII